LFGVQCSEFSLETVGFNEPGRLKTGLRTTNDFRRNKMETHEANAKIRTANAVAHIIRTFGVLFFVAMAFGVMSWKYAIFAGTACMIIAPAVRRLMISGE
jgi:hypothetical protein